MKSCQAFFDELAPTWDRDNHADADKVAHILDIAGVRAGSRVLDVGTGTGILVPYLAQRVGPTGHVTAIDLSTEMLRVARGKYGALANVTFQQTDVENDPIADKYDAIILYCMYPHLEQPLDTLRWLTHLNLTADGALVIAFGSSKDFINSIHRHCDGSVHSTRLPEGEEFKRHLEAAGLVCDYVEDTPEIYIVRLRAS